MFGKKGENPPGDTTWKPPSQLVAEKVGVPENVSQTRNGGPGRVRHRGLVIMCQEFNEPFGVPCLDEIRAGPDGPLML